MSVYPEVDALYSAILDQQYEDVEALVPQCKNNLNTPIAHTSALAAAVHIGNKDICRCLLDAGAHVDFGGRSGRFPLYIAAHNGDIDIVQLLVERGAAINLKHMTGNTPLLEAVLRGHVPMVSYLISAGANPLITNNAGETCLHLAAISGSLELIGLFLETGIDVNASQVSSYTPLHLAVYGATKNHYHVAEMLIKRTANVNAKLPSGRTALHFAAMRNAVDMAQLLLDNGCEVDPVSTDNDEHKTPLSKAVDAGHLSMVKLLIDAGADIDFCDHWGSTALLSAIFSGKVEIALTLVQAGSDINMASKGGFTPFRASLRHQPHMTQMLVLAGCTLGQGVKTMLDSPLENKLYNSFHDIRDWILDMIKSPKTLQQLSREEIRKQMSKTNIKFIFSLPVPQRLARYLNLGDVEDILTYYQG